MELSRVTDRTESLSVPGSLGIGDRLRNAREAKRLTLDAAAQQTRIRAAYLQALENEEFTKLPGPIYAKGFLRVYASSLGLDADALLAVYPEAFAAPRPSLVGRPGEIPIRPAAPPSRLRRIVAYVVVGVVIVAGALGYVGYQGWRAFNTPIETEPVAPPSASSPFEEPPMPVVPRPAPPVLPAPPEPAPPVAPAPSPPAAVPGIVSVTVRAAGTTWLRVTAAERRLFEGLLHRGDVRTWSARGAMTLRIGNAPAAVVEVNGRRIPTPAGLRVWQQTFEPSRQ